MLFALRSAGSSVHLASCESTTENPWTDQARAWLAQEACVDGLSVFTQPARRPLRGLPERAWSYMKRRAGGLAQRVEPSASDSTTVEMRRWFRQLVAGRSWDRIVMNYVGFSPLLPESTRGARTVLETHDLVSLHAKMSRAIARYIPDGPIFEPDALPEHALELGFYDDLALQADDAEYRGIDRYDVALAITTSEAVAMRAHTRHARIVTIPMPGVPAARRAEHGTSALFPMGPHAFNLQGYAWFVRRVLPRIRIACPGFELGVSGTLYRHTTLTYRENVRILGFVADPRQLWGLARFLVNPVFGGTGQPIKTIEGMASGIPPVILERFAHAAPVQHGVNGFIARDEHDFADHCVHLWNDPQLCWRMGQAAIETIERTCSRAQFVTQVSEALA